MGLFSRASTTSVDPRWNNPAFGLTESDFARWPGRDKPKRAKLIPKIEAGIAVGAVELPVRVVGKCTTYDSKNGHPSFQQAIHEAVDFVVSGISQPIIATFRKAPDLIRGFDIEDTRVERFSTNHGGYIDLQFQSAAGPLGRIGFLFSHGGEAAAQSCIQLVAAALKDTTFE